MRAGVPTGVVICPVLPWPPEGGAEKRTLRLLEVMSRSGIHVRLVSSDRRLGASEALRERGWRVDVVDEPRSSLPRRAVQHARRRPSPYLGPVAERLRRLGDRPALVQVEHPMASYYTRAHPSGVPYVLSTQNVDSEMLASVARGLPRPGLERLATWNRARAMATTERRAATDADTVLCVSEHDQGYYERLGANTLLVPNGIDEELFSVPAAAGKERVLFFGRMDYPPNDSGLRRFLAGAWPRVADRRPSATLRVVGAGLGVETAKRVSAAPRATAVGRVAEIKDELAAADIVIVPIWQGGGTRLKALEALGAGRAIVGTPLGVSGIGIRDGVHAVLGTSDVELAEALERVLADPAVARSLGDQGRRLAQGFRWSATTAPAAALYARLAGTG